MKQEHITLRCEDGAEAVVFTKYTYKYDNTVSYDISVEDDYIGGDYKGFFGRIKRAWRAFWDKPVVYTGIFCEDKEKMRKFLINCLDLMDENDTEEIKTMYQQMKGNTTIGDSVTSNVELIKDKAWEELMKETK